MEYSDQSIILQTGKFREIDLWVRYLSPTRGVQSAFAFGGSRSKRRFTGCLDAFNEVLLRVAPSKRGQYLALQEGLLIKGPKRLRTDWQRFGMANNCSKFLQSFGVDAQGAAKAHFVLHQVLRLLEEADTLPLQLPLFFRARLAFDHGYALQTETCSSCGQGLAGRGGSFSLHDGQFVCRLCEGKLWSQGPRMALGGEALEILAAMQKSDPSEWGEIPLASAAGAQCARVLDGFIQYHVGLAWENGCFMRV